jgi:hypothetical protein
VPHAGATPIIFVIMVDRSRDPLKTLLAPFFATLGALPAAMGGDVGWCSLSVARGRLPTPLGWTRHDHLVANGVLDGVITRCLESVPEEVSMLALV